MTCKKKLKKWKLIDGVRDTFGIRKTNCGNLVIGTHIDIDGDIWMGIIIWENNEVIYHTKQWPLGLTKSLTELCKEIKKRDNRFIGEPGDIKKYRELIKETYKNALEIQI